MTVRKDIELTNDGDLKIVNGDLLVSQSDQQHVQDIFRSFSGEFKEFPLLGFGAAGYLKKNSDKYTFLRNLRQQLRYDGYSNVDIEVDNTNNIEIKI